MFCVPPGEKKWLTVRFKVTPSNTTCNRGPPCCQDRARPHQLPGNAPPPPSPSEHRDTQQQLSWRPPSWKHRKTLLETPSVVITDATVRATTTDESYIPRSTAKLEKPDAYIFAFEGWLVRMFLKDSLTGSRSSLLSHQLQAISPAASYNAKKKLKQKDEMNEKSLPCMHACYS